MKGAEHTHAFVAIDSASVIRYQCTFIKWIECQSLIKNLDKSICLLNTHTDTFGVVCA